MKAFKIIALVLVMVLAISAAGVVGYKLLKSQKAKISVESNPSATVYIAGEEVGKTPYQGIWEAGEVIIKLVPGDPLVPYETKVNLLADRQTLIKRDFGSSEEASGGQIISYEKVGANETSLSLLSTPDYAQVSIDGNIRGFSPIMNYSVSSDTHQVVVTKIGYLDNTFEVSTQKGYKAVVVVKLIATGEPIASPSASVSPSPTPASVTNVYVQILDTPSGFLRVRAEGSTTSNEIARVKPGDKLLFVSQDAKGEWYQVVYAEGEVYAKGDKKGWVFSQYAKKLD